MNNQEFSTNLRRYSNDADKRYALVKAQAETLEKDIDVIPAHYMPEAHPAIRNAWWREGCMLDYSNVYDFYGWEALPDFDSKAVRAFLHGMLA